MAKDKLVTFGEIMMRLSTDMYQTLNQANYLNVNYGGGEANVAVSLSHFEHDTYFITKLPSNALGDSAIKHLQGNGVKTDYISRGGTNLGIYFLETGFGGRPSKVIYNRKNSAITTIDSNDFDFDTIFNGAKWFHVSGITLALGNNVLETVHTAVKIAKQHNVLVSLDFNYRKSLWSVEEAKEAYKLILPYVDVVFASMYDFNTIVDIDSFEEDLELKRKDIFKKAMNFYDLKYIFGTDRIVHSATENSLRGYCYTEEEEFISEYIQFAIFDRIGGGDAYASGVIHSLLENFNDTKNAVDFGLVTSVLKHTIQGDVSVLKKEDILEYLQSTNRYEVRR